MSNMFHIQGSKTDRGSFGWPHEGPEDKQKVAGDAAECRDHESYCMCMRRALVFHSKSRLKASF
jgi:hypothetical protein